MEIQFLNVFKELPTTRFRQKVHAGRFPPPKMEKQWFRWVIRRNHNTPEMSWPFTCGWTALRRPHNDHYIMTLVQVSVEKNRAELPVSLPRLTFINGFIISRPWPVLPDRTAMPWLSRQITANPDHEESFSKSPSLWREGKPVFLLLSWSEMCYIGGGGFLNG